MLLVLIPDPGWQHPRHKRLWRAWEAVQDDCDVQVHRIPIPGEPLTWDGGNPACRYDRVQQNHWKFARDRGIRHVLFTEHDFLPDLGTDWVKNALEALGEHQALGTEYVTRWPIVECVAEAPPGQGGLLKRDYIVRGDPMRLTGSWFTLFDLKRCPAHVDFAWNRDFPDPSNHLHLQLDMHRMPGEDDGRFPSVNYPGIGRHLFWSNWYHRRAQVDGCNLAAAGIPLALIHAGVDRVTKDWLLTHE